MRITAAAALVSTFLLPTLVAAGNPVAEVGRAAPELRLSAAGGGNRSLAEADGPIVLVFYRGLW